MNEETRRLQTQQRQAIMDACRVMRISPTELARKAGVAPSTVNRFLKGGDKVNWVLSGRTWERLRTYLHPSPEDILPQETGARIEGLGALRRSTDRLFHGEDLPVLGDARGGDHGFFFENGAVRAYVPRPSGLVKVQNAYAVYMNGHSMEPRYFPGELLYIHPIRPAKPGDFVCLELVDGQGFIKQLVRRTQKTVFVSQLNPPKQIEIPADNVKSIHLVVGSAIL
jgi:phage repressor protein C with HTH and peptisase S24 domain